MFHRSDGQPLGGGPGRVLGERHLRPRCQDLAGGAPRTLGGNRGPRVGGDQVIEWVNSRWHGEGSDKAAGGLLMNAPGLEISP